MHAPFSGGHAGHDLGAVLAAHARVKEAAAAGNPLDQDFRVFVDRITSYNVCYTKLLRLPLTL